MKIRIMAKNGERLIELNRRKAIHERCLNCSCWVPSEVRYCTFTDCPLYPYRTGKGKQNAKSRREAIRKYCLWCQGDQKSEVAKCVSKTCPLFPYRLRRIDHSVEIVPEPKSAHIEAVSQVKSGLNAYCMERSVSTSNST